MGQSPTGAKLSCIGSVVLKPECDSEMAQWVKGLAVKLDEPCSIPETHMVEAENASKLSSNLHTHVVYACMFPPPLIITKTVP